MFFSLKNFFKKRVDNSNDFPTSETIKLEKDFVIGKYKSLQIDREAIINIERNVSFREFCNVLVFKHAQLNIHENVFFNNYCSINCLQKIEIGNNTLFGEGVKIYDHNHKYSTDKILQVKRNEYNTAPVNIGKNCWIGSNVVILKGVVIEDNVIIGANNIIYKSINSGSVIKSGNNFNVAQL